MIRAIGLGRTFTGRSGDPVVALDDLDLEIPAGILVVIHGPSGCGKSTLLNLVGLLDRPTAGRLNLFGSDVESMSPSDQARQRRALIGFLFQDAGLIEPMTVSENIALPLAYRRGLRAERGNAVSVALEAVGLIARARSAVSELSGGERQRVGLARALASQPKLLVCDEPTAALDRENSVAITALLKAQAHEGALVMCSSHDPLLISQADMLISLEHGRQVPAL
jgi:putative ABC transport system ATP-binding protein